MVQFNTDDVKKFLKIKRATYLNCLIPLVIRRLQWILNRIPIYLSSIGFRLWLSNKKERDWFGSDRYACGTCCS